MRNSSCLFGIILLVLVAAFFGSCEDDNLDDLQRGIPKIKTFTYEDDSAGTVTQTYAYDSEGRLSTVTYSGGISGVTLYTYYYPDSITELKYDGETTTYTLNSDGYVSIVDTGLLNYDSEGYLTSLTSSTQLLFFTWTDGNLTRIASLTDTTNITYWTDKTNTIGYYNRGVTFLGKDSKNLVKTATTNGNARAFSYEYDAQNRVTKVNGAETYTYY